MMADDTKGFTHDTLTSSQVELQIVEALHKVATRSHETDTAIVKLCETILDYSKKLHMLIEAQQGILETLKDRIKFIENRID